MPDWYMQFLDRTTPLCSSIRIYREGVNFEAGEFWGILIG